MRDRFAPVACRKLQAAFLRKYAFKAHIYRKVWKGPFSSDCVGYYAQSITGIIWLGSNYTEALNAVQGLTFNTLGRIHDYDVALQGEAHAN